MAEAAEEQASGVAPDPAYRERYPWHADLWTRLVRDPAQLPHALLFHGPIGLGKRAFAWRFAQYLLCSSPTAEGGACGNCVSCRRFAVGTHPDLLSVTTLGDSTTITVDQVRMIRDFVALKPHTAARKLVILEPAEAMNVNAANALLKVLEEPPAASALFLITPAAARLPATIRSRCIALPFRAPEAQPAIDWLRAQGVDEPGPLLEAAGGAPLRALALSRSGEVKERAQVMKDIQALRNGTESPLLCAGRWKSYGAMRCLEWFQQYLAARIATESDQKNTKQLKVLFQFFDVISEAKALSASPLDETLLLEDMLLQWSDVARRIG
ncbi:MAG: DNA polymerase III subunit delta' [Sulfurifustis sp.]